MASNTPKTYKDFVEYRRQRNPCVGGLAAFLTKRQLPQDSCQVYAVGFNVGGNADHSPPVRKVHHSDLPSVLTTTSPGRGLVLIVEDLHPSTVEILGATLDIDPLFFADYISTSLEDIENSPGPPSVALTPSQILSQMRWFHIHYQQIVDLSQDRPLQLSSWVLKTSGNVTRSVRRLTLPRGRQLGIVRGCCAVMVKEFEQSWVGIILVDSSTSDIVSDPVFNLDVGLRLRRVALHNGFEDFQRPPSFLSFRSSGHRCNLSGRRGSLLNQTLAYISEHPLLFTQAAPSTLKLAYYPLKAALSEWGVYSQVLARFLKHYEYSLDGARQQVHEGDMIQLQKWRHRIIQTRFKLNSTKEFISYHCTAEPERAAWELLLRDLDSVSLKISQYGQSLERIIPVAASMALLFHYQRSATEATFIKRLTCAALVFVPLSWVAALFSMTDDFAPGQPKFWVYFVVSLPFCLFTVLGTLVMSNFGNVGAPQLNPTWEEIIRKTRPWLLGQLF